MNIPSNLKYTKDHEWVLIDGDTATVGITDFAQKELGDIVYVQLPKVGDLIVSGKVCGEVESTKSVSENVLKHSPKTIIVVVSNPMDTMTYLTLKATGLAKNRIIGMGGALDSSRFKTYLSKALDTPANDIHGMVIGGHGDTTMIPLTRLATYNGLPISDLITEEELEKVSASTMVGGATLTKLLGTSAWYAPGASVAFLVKTSLCLSLSFFQASPRSLPVSPNEVPGFASRILARFSPLKIMKALSGFFGALGPSWISLT